MSSSVSNFIKEFIIVNNNLILSKKKNVLYSIGGGFYLNLNFNWNRIYYIKVF